MFSDNHSFFPSFTILSYPALDANIANLLKNMGHSASLAHLLIFYALICVLDTFLAVVESVKPSLRELPLYFN
jgi:hypothetical protein